MTRRSGRLPVTFCLCMVHASLIPSHGTAGYSPPAFRSCPLFLPLFTPYRPPNHFPPRSTALTPLTPFRSYHLRNLFRSATLPPFLPPFRLTQPPFDPSRPFPPRFPPHRFRPYHLPVAVCRYRRLPPPAVRPPSAFPASALSSAIRSMRSDGRASGGFVLILFLPVVTIPGCVELICRVCCGDLVLLVKHKL